MQHDAERVDVGRGRKGRAGDLLRRCVSERHRSTHNFREFFVCVRVGLRRVEFWQKFRDTEIEEAHVAVRVYQYISWFQVAMQHELAMRVIDSIEHL